jgi:hypothetical protein
LKSSEPRGRECMQPQTIILPCGIPLARSEIISHTWTAPEDQVSMTK